MDATSCLKGSFTLSDLHACFRSHFPMLDPATFSVLSELSRAWK